MKKILYVLALVGICSFSSCGDALDTNPTDKVSGSLIFGNADAAQVAMNGVYRALFVNGWSVNWSHENPGLMTMNLVKDLQGEDHLMANQGQGWFYYDYSFQTDGDWTHTSGRQYAQWNLYYTIISQVNYVIDAASQLESFGARGQYVLAQAYTVRGFAYFCLYNFFCKGNYPENKGTAGVPIYVEATSANTVGQPRGTVEKLFERINEDYRTAVRLFEASGVTQANPTNADLYVAYGLWARAAQAQEAWGDAATYANKALEKPGLTRVASMTDLGQFNNCKAPSIMWGFQVIADQTGPYGAFLSHMDPEGGYGKIAQQCIDAWLWGAIPDTDARKRTWWDDPEASRYYPYEQLKFRYSDFSTYLGDVIYLRAEEMVLIAAEAACRLNDYTTARALLKELGDKRDTNYDAVLAARTDAATYNTNTHGAFMTLMDEILFQRRVELWSEGMGRAYDLCRLNLGYNRNYSGSNHTAKNALDPGDDLFVTLIPQKEFDGNSSMSVADQNPR